MPSPQPSPSREREPETLDYAAPLPRQIGLFGATMLGLGSILGTGVFVGIPQATALAGPWVLVAIVLAGLLAFCNAMSSVQLAAAYPVSGGTYEFGCRLLSPAWGFTAGWTFLLAKSASAATAALGLLEVLPRPYEAFTASWAVEGYTTFWIWLYEHQSFRQLSAAAVALTTLATIGGIGRTNFLNMILVGGVVAILIAMIGTCVWSGLAHEVRPWVYFYPSVRPFLSARTAQATALCFVAFTGFGRLAKLGEEVLEPAITIPRAIALSLVSCLLIYFGVAFLQVLAGHRLDPSYGLPTLAGFFGQRWLINVVRLAGMAAMLGVLLNLIPDLSRVWLAMRTRGDMPRVLARVSDRSATPVPATILAGLVIAAFVLVGDVRLTWSFSAFSVLIYYAITNWACLRLPVEHRRYPRSLAWAGLVACLSLAWFVEVKAWAVGVALIGIGLAWYRIRRRSMANDSQNVE